MVGVRSKRSCARCKQRKVKCDETIPSCGRCIRSNRPCPGYDSGYVFKDETKRLTKSSTSYSQESASNFIRKGPMLSVAPTIVLPTDRLGLQLAGTIYSSIPENKRLDSIIAHVFPFIPSRLGTCAALDNAIDCLTLTHECTLTGSSQMSKEVFKSYGRTIRSLRTDLSTNWNVNEMLCATHILILLETMIFGMNTNYLTHAVAISRIIQARGQDSFKDGFAHAIFLSSYYYIWGASMTHCSPLFLSTKKWEDCMLPTEYELSLDPQSTLRGQMFKGLSRLPSILARFYCSLERADSQTGLKTLLEQSLKQRDKMINKHHEWMEDYGTAAYMIPATISCKEWVSHPPSRVFTSYDLAWIQMIYWPQLMIINRLISYLSPQRADSLIAQNKELADAICESYAYCREQGIWRGLCVSLGLTLSFGEFYQDDHKRAWILQKFGELVPLGSGSPFRIGNVGAGTPIHRCIKTLFPGILEMGQIT